MDYIESQAWNESQVDTFYEFQRWDLDIIDPESHFFWTCCEVDILESASNFKIFLHTTTSFIKMWSQITSSIYLYEAIGSFSCSKIAISAIALWISKAMSILACLWFLTCSRKEIRCAREKHDILSWQFAGLWMQKIFPTRGIGFEHLMMLRRRLYSCLKSFNRFRKWQSSTEKACLRVMKACQALQWSWGSALDAIRSQLSPAW